jgi:hypothetical protein
VKVRFVGATLAGVALVVAALAGCQSASPVSAGTAPGVVASSGSPSARPSSSGLALLATLAVKGRAPMTGYARAQFGPAWPSMGGCDARNEVLRRDLTNTVLRDDCVVLSGTLVSPYSATTIDFVRGPNSADVQIDHVVALGDAWQTGAQQWSTQRREAFANDPQELLAVDAHSNEQKGDSDAASWLPSNKAFRCAYVATQVRVKARYRLWVTPAERDAMRRVLSSCR